MADIGKLTIGVSLSVDEKTAQACLKIIEMYVNQTGADIIGHREDDGSIAYHFEYGFDAQKLGIEPKEVDRGT